ncbi:MAG TPA: sigma-70 family RNA polymerase sigma factor [Candidatus Angelobacter sp.]|nr:sigma-70 family RNA polymerase sigma factor [Candidatus Angelobacter sp.]
MPKRAREAPTGDLSRLLDGLAFAVDQLFTQSGASTWRLTREQFCAALHRSASKRFASEPGTPQKLRQYLDSLHLDDLALASACAAGCESAWEHFVNTYRPYLRASAAAILHCPATSPAACELADSLFTDLYGLAEARGSERSLFRYFHGRSSLKTWLRAVLAQRHIESIRASSRFKELSEEETSEPSPAPPLGAPVQHVDPHRELYVSLFARALQAALDALAPVEKNRLRLYYAEEKTLAEIGRFLGEHESSVSRHLERVRRELRQGVEEILRRGFAATNGSAAQPGLSDAEITLCFEYSAENTSLDLDKLLPRPRAVGPAAGKRTS